MSCHELVLPPLAQTVADGRFCDLVLVAGQGGGNTRVSVPAVRLLLAALDGDGLAEDLDALAPGAMLELPSTDATQLRGLIALSSGARPGPSTWADCEALAALREAATLARDTVAARSLAAKPADAAAPRTASRSAKAAAATCGLLLLVGGLLAFKPALHFSHGSAGELFMDDRMIAQNLLVVADGPLDWRALLRTDYWGQEMFGTQWTHKSFRPLAVLTFRWSFQLHGFESPGFHATNVALHAAATVLLGLCGLRLLRLPPLDAGLLAAIFATQPAHTEAVLYIVGRADLLCTVLLLLAALVYAPCISRGAPRGGVFRVLLSTLCLTASSVLLVAAGLCKETGFTFFGVPVVAELLALLRLSGRARLRAAPGHVVRVAALLSAGGAVCSARWWYTSGAAIADMDPYSNPLIFVEDAWVRRRSYALVHGMYAQLLAWPTFLCYDYGLDAVPTVASPADVRLLLPCAAYLGLVASISAAASALRRRRRSGHYPEGIACGLVATVLGLLPASNLIFPVGTLVGERLIYIPSVGALVVLVAGALHAAGARRSRRVAARLVLLLLVAHWWRLCRVRVLEWETAESITLADGARQPRSAIVQFNLGNAHLKAGRLDDALAAYRHSIAADPLERDAQPLHHAGLILLYRGEFAEAEHMLRKAVEGFFSPITMPEYHYWKDYGLVLFHVDRAREGAAAMRYAINLEPSLPLLHNNLGCGLAIYGLNVYPADEAAIYEGLDSLDRAISLQPHAPLYLRNVIAILTAIGNHVSAQQAYRRLLEIEPMAAYEPAPATCTYEFALR
eukprot:NODE_1196_length_2565_cov_4.629614.p1 GENE.NODE_1196_length_2565_cov_4.629614~~NODE_1196_length_2565_cov_4.629614.p1  ORF type:complete len:795 (-),score=224.95 NODE_1196_length_2565_cov_4.629614:45-2429(-)